MRILISLFFLVIVNMAFSQISVEVEGEEYVEVNELQIDKQQLEDMFRKKMERRFHKFKSITGSMSFQGVLEDKNIISEIEGGTLQHAELENLLKETFRSDYIPLLKKNKILKDHGYQYTLRIIDGKLNDILLYTYIKD